MNLYYLLQKHPAITIMDNGNDPPPAFHIWKFLMENMIPCMQQNNGLICSDINECKLE